MKKTILAATIIALSFTASATDGNVVTGYSAVAAGYNNVAQGNYATAVGVANQASGNESAAIGERAIASADNASAFGSMAKASGVSALALGSGAQATNDTSVALGNDSVTSSKSAVSLGGSAKASHQFGVALGDSSETIEAAAVTSATVGGVTYGNFAGSAPTAVVSVGTTTLVRQVVNMGAGEVSATSTDAINGSQLYAVAEQVSANKADIAINRADIDAQAAQIAANRQAIAQRAQSAVDQQAAINRNNAAIAQVRADVAGLNSRVTLVDKKLRAGIAGAGAIAALPQVRKDGHHALAVGASHYRGESAVAVKYSQAAESGKWTYALSGSIDTRGNGLIAGGVAREW